MKNFKIFLLEAIYKTITKQNAIDKGITWYDAEDSIVVYTYPPTTNEIAHSFKNYWHMIKIGITNEPKLFFWRGTTLHATVEQLLGVEFLMKLNLNMSNDFFTVSPDNFEVLDNPKRFVENKINQPLFNTLEQSFPNIKKLKIGGTTFWL